MTGRAIYTYNSNPKLKQVIDSSAEAVAASMELAHGADAMTGTEIPATLREVVKHYLIHGEVIVVKHISTDVPAVTSFSILHPDFDDVKVNMEPSPRLTLTRYVPALKKEEKIVLADTLFRVYRGGFTDIDMLDLLTFLGYTFA